MLTLPDVSGSFCYDLVVTRKAIGHTSAGREIEAFFLGPNTNRKVLIIAGVHGDEVEGVVAARRIVETCKKNEPSFCIIVIPILNADGFLAGTRKNSRGVDLNRNLPTKDWTSIEANERYSPGSSPNSEAENKALLTFIDSIKPALIISLHSYKEPMLNVNGECQDTAVKISKTVNYPVKEDIGYPTPGCLGTYYGLERDIPVLTYELLRGMDAREVESIHAPALISALD